MGSIGLDAVHSAPASPSPANAPAAALAVTLRPSVVSSSSSPHTSAPETVVETQVRPCAALACSVAMLGGDGMPRGRAAYVAAM